MVKARSKAERILKKKTEPDSSKDPSSTPRASSSRMGKRPEASTARRGRHRGHRHQNPPYEEEELDLDNLHISSRSELRRDNKRRREIETVERWMDNVPEGTPTQSASSEGQYGRDSVGPADSEPYLGGEQRGEQSSHWQDRPEYYAAQYPHSEEPEEAG
jgi:hypothetical protein